MQRAKDFERLISLGHRVSISAASNAPIWPGVTRTAVPGGRHDALVVVDLGVLILIQ